MHARLMRDPPPPRGVNRELTPQIEEIILHALERKPPDRYVSVAALKAELDSPEKVIVTGVPRGYTIDYLLVWILRRSCGRTVR